MFSYQMICVSKVIRGRRAAVNVALEQFKLRVEPPPLAVCPRLHKPFPGRTNIKRETLEEKQTMGTQQELVRRRENRPVLSPPLGSLRLISCSEVFFVF